MDDLNSTVDFGGVGTEAASAAEARAAQQHFEDNIERVAEFFAKNDQSDKQSSDSDPDEKETCWICLDGSEDEHALVAPCKCPRKAHAKCLARWQLQSAGSKEETHCRFCNHELPNWRAALTPQVKSSKSPLVVTVCSNGQEHDICVDNQNENGVDNFSEHIRNLFGIQTNVQLKFTFYCTEPTTGDLITLEGAGAYNAAMHCASVSASKRGGKKPAAKYAHGRTNSSLAALGGEPVTRPQGHARSRSMGSASDHSSASGDIASHPGAAMDHRLRSELDRLPDDDDDLDGSHDDLRFDLPSGQMSADDIYSQMPLKRRLRALGKRMMRSLRLSSPMP